MSDERTVIVHKASVSLNSGETIHEYIRKVSQKGREHCKKKLNLEEKKSYVYMEEAYGDSAVFSVEKYTDASTGGAKYYDVSYKRDGEDFEFGELTEVEKVTSFKPVKEKISVAKIKLDKEDFWSGAI